MSIVGPRPERPRFVKQFADMYPRYRERLLVRPGITGWSHVHMPRNHDQTQLAERLRLDLEYIRYWSLYMDLSVVFKTAAELLFQKAH
jgi:lipopolysaccharide/colanic/teichoic acid biosynthesis glycosyltransferase